jgi:hypothetical protein
MRKPAFAALALALAACQPAGMSPSAPVAPQASAAAFSLAAPPPGEGVQISIGPFDVPPGTEVQKNFFMKLPVDEDVAISRIQIAYPQGSHHCNLFKSDRHQAPDHVEDTFDAVAYDLYDMFAAAQTGNMDWTFPEGVVLRLKKRHQLIVQTHWVNGVTQRTPGDKGQVKINLWFAKDAEKAQNLGMLFAINKNLDILPHTTTKEKKFVDLKRLGFDQDVKILAMTGHFHSRGRAFEISRLDGDTPTEQLYRSDNWDEPPFKQYEPHLDLKAGERLLYTSTFVNDSDMVIKFGPKVETQEHSNLFMYFYPGPPDGRSLYDTDGAP